MTVTLDKGVPVALFLESSESAIEVDLEHQDSSLMHYALMPNDVEALLRTTPQQEVGKLFAQCVFKYHCGVNGLYFKELIEVPGIPIGLENFSLGGNGDPQFSTCAVVIHRKYFPPPA